LQETDRNVPAEDVTKQNNFTAIYYVSAALKLSTPVVIQNCSAKYGF
jgi:hypothetical protein